MRKFRDHEKNDIEILINLYELRPPIPPARIRRKWGFVSRPCMCIYICIYASLAPEQLVGF